LFAALWRSAGDEPSLEVKLIEVKQAYHLQMQASPYASNARPGAARAKHIPIQVTYPTEVEKAKPG
jgi:hypothetical protein